MTYSTLLICLLAGTTLWAIGLALAPLTMVALVVGGVVVVVALGLVEARG